MVNPIYNGRPVAHLAVEMESPVPLPRTVPATASVVRSSTWADWLAA